MGKRRFEIELRGEAIIELDDAVIEAVDDEWRSVFYDFLTPIDIAEHLGWNLVANAARLSMLDGWADQPDRNAQVVEDFWEVVAIEVT